MADLMADLRVVRLGYSPLKGARHESYQRVTLDEHGVVGDRRFCLVDVAARRVLRTVQHPELIGIRAHEAGDEAGGGLSVELPDGTTATGPLEPRGALECDYWGRTAPLRVVDGEPARALIDHVAPHVDGPVALTAAPPRAVVYGAGLSILTRASLDDLAARIGEPVDAARFRASIVLETGEEAYAEEGWTGRELTLGDAVVRVGAPIPRCAVIDLDPVTGERTGRLLRTLAAHRPVNAAGEPCFGVYAEVVRPGTVSVTTP